jgi:PAS domain S-box-containing protein
MTREKIIGNDSYVLMAGIRKMPETKSQGEDPLLESEELFRLFMDYSPTTAWLKDEQGRYLYINKTYEKRFGLKLQEQLGKTDAELWTPEIAQAYRRNDFAVLAAGHPLEFSEETINPDGSRCCWIVCKFPFRDKSEKLFLGGLGLEITSLKLAEEGLRQAQKDLERAQEVGNFGSWRLNTRQNILSWSDETYRIFEVPSGTPLSYETFLSSVHPDDREFVDVQWKAALNGGPYDIEHRIIVDGQVKWVREKAFLEFDQTGKLTGGFGIAQDITQKKEAEQSLRQLSQFPEENPNPVLRVGLDGVLLYANVPARDLMVSLGWHLDGLLPPKILAAMVEAHSQNKPIEEEIKSPDGRTFIVTVIQPPGERYVNLYGRDITERKIVEEALRESEFRFRTIVENAGAGIGEADPDGRMVMVNEQLCRILGRPREEIIGKIGRDFIYSEDRPKADKLHEDMRAGRIDSFQEELRYNRPDGQIVWARVAATHCKDPKSGLPRRIAVIEDISEQKKTEKQLEEYRVSLEEKIKKRTTRLRQLSSVFLNATDAIIIEDLEGNIIEVNREAERAYGYSRAELIGNSINMLFLPERHKRAKTLRKRCRQGEELRNIDGIRRDKSGNILSVLVSAFPLRDENDQIVAIANIAKDISLRKQMEGALRKSRDRLQELSRKTIEALEADRRAVSRELHDSIGASLAALKFMLEEAAEGVPGSAILQKSIVFLLNTIKEVKRISTNLRPMAIDDLGLIVTIRGHAQQFQIHFGLRCDCFISVSEQEVPESMKIVVFRVLQEALANAGKHSGANRVRVILEKSNGQIVLAVEDDGCGFDADDPSPKDPLSGYGLKSMRERVEICQGDFSIVSSAGRGTKVIARFPIAMAEACSLRG